jgi:hypothetical protein
MLVRKKSSHGPTWPDSCVRHERFLSIGKTDENRQWDDRESLLELDLKRGNAAPSSGYAACAGDCD